MKRLEKSIKKQNLSKVSSHLNPLNCINIFANKARDIYRKPYVFRVDGIYFDKKEITGSNFGKNKAIWEGIEKASGVIIQSYFDYKLVSRFYGNINRPVCIINNGVDCDIFSPVSDNKRKELSIDERDLVFITSAKWRKHKRLNDIVNVFLEFGEKSDRVCHLIILGKNSVLEGVNDPRIHNIGFVPSHELPMWYRTGNIFLFFSWLDHCPNTVIEAIACGLPVICTNQGGTKELVEMTNSGIITEADDEFIFEPVELYNPPIPDYNKILEAINKIVSNYDSYVRNIDRTMINIDNVTMRYVKFIKKMMMGNRVDFEF